MRRADPAFRPDEASREDAWTTLLTRVAFTTERTLEVVERLQAENEALRRRLESVQAERVTGWVGAEEEVQPSLLGELEGATRVELGRAGDCRLWLVSARDGTQGALLVEEHDRARAAARLGALEEELLRRLDHHRNRSGTDHPPVPAKVLAYELGRSGLPVNPAPGTVRSAFTRVRRKLRALGFGTALLAGGRQGYRLVAPTP